jgi:hypothetical protein
MEVRKVLSPVDLAGSTHKIAPWVRFIADRFEFVIYGSRSFSAA